MKNWLESIRQFMVREDGPTAVEYAVMLMLIFLVCLTAVQALGIGFGETMTENSDAIGKVLN